MTQQLYKLVEGGMLSPRRAAHSPGRRASAGWPPEAPVCCWPTGSSRGGATHLLRLLATIAAMASSLT